MRTEVKVGAAIAFVLVVIGTWAVIFRFNPPSGSRKPAPAPARPTNVVTAERPALPTGRSASSPASAPAMANASASKPVETVRRTETAEEPWWKSAPAKSATSAPAPSSVVRNAASRPAESAKPATPVSPAVAASMPTGMGHTYKVKSNDTYWSIAKSEYGDGSLYAVIQSANKGAALHEGMAIHVPPKPAPAAVATNGAAAPAAASPTAANANHTSQGTGTDQASGKRFYVVKQGDRGFYGIARDVLGDAKMLKALEEANPGVDSEKLKIGQKLWLPASASVTSRPASSVASATSKPSKPATAAPRTLTTSSPRSTPVAPAAAPTPAPTPAPAAPSGGTTFD